jgi:hypothetical protein
VSSTRDSVLVVVSVESWLSFSVAIAKTRYSAVGCPLKMFPKVKRSWIGYTLMDKNMSNVKRKECCTGLNV